MEARGGERERDRERERGGRWGHWQICLTLVMITLFVEH